ncbi:Protein of unknown function [Streptomyces sp. DvalAA-14]|uniref:DUF3631 domain-containing protein n=1 Tax=unclassified Streptomyces TaxID=2593676 RepID=UPI00081B3C70|nr:MULTISPECIES: DUF3631 domain-containing protein [unclassified Streptomyces]MYS24681.1 DUF3631 domain-containing protein [Streptomyces sp. SID4948]SCE48373.1 Protein of unknown function [Streptomyces sp. DvalAA-14]
MTTENGATLLDEIEGFHRRFNAFPTQAAYVAVVLWNAHSHLLDCFDSTPRLAFLSPEPGSGKTRGLEICGTLVPNPMAAVNASPAALFRAVSMESGRPTILFDEIDTVFGPKAGDNEELRGLINAGHRRIGVSYRCVSVGDQQVVQPFPVYAAVAMAGLGWLPDTILHRSVVIRMRRRAPNEHVEAFRARIHEPEGHELRDRLAAWADAVRDRVAGAFPAMPEGVNDRPADVWEPLLAVADAAGGTWPDRARNACVELVTAAAEGSKASLGIGLLTDLRTVFNGADRMPTAQIVAALTDMDEAPWADVDGKPLNSRLLSKHLAEYVTADNQPIKARNIRLGGGVVKGYYATDLRDAWARYCPPPPGKSATSATHPEKLPLTSHDAVADTTR